MTTAVIMSIGNITCGSGDAHSEGTDWFERKNRAARTVFGLEARRIRIDRKQGWRSESPPGGSTRRRADVELPRPRCSSGWSVALSSML